MCPSKLRNTRSIRLLQPDDKTTRLLHLHFLCPASCLFASRSRARRRGALLRNWVIRLLQWDTRARPGVARHENWSRSQLSSPRPFPVVWKKDELRGNSETGNPAAPGAGESFWLKAPFPSEIPKWQMTNSPNCNNLKVCCTFSKCILHVMFADK